MTIGYSFVEYFPEKLQDGILYISITFCTAAHKCCCGCGNEVITPISPTDWKIIFDGASITLSPSIGNWSFDCKSHYWIKNNYIIWAEEWSDEQINAGRNQDTQAKKNHYKSKHSQYDQSRNDTSKNNIIERLKFWSKLSGWWKSLKQKL